MTLTLTAKPASPKQLSWVLDMLRERPNWRDLLDGEIYETAFDVLGNVGNPDPKFIAMAEIRALITALLKTSVTKTVIPTGGAAPTPFTRLQVLLATIKPGYYALPRSDGTGTFNFFRVVEVEKGTWAGRRFVNQLVGAPTAWNRIKPKMPQQLQIARAIALDVTAAARAYARYHTKCARCNADLSNPRSQVALVGEHCAGEWGWPW